MVKQAQAAKTQETTVEIDRKGTVREGFRAFTGAGAAAEIAEVLVLLRSHAMEFDLKFLSYLLEMAYIEAFEQSRRDDRQP